MTQIRTDPRAERHRDKKSALVESAWTIARREGFGGLSLHALAREAGMRQPSLYVYFDSKADLIEALFADGNRKLLERIEAVDLPKKPIDAVRAVMHEFVAFCMEDPPRAELMFHRPIPGFEPSADAYAPAQRFLERIVALLGRAGLTEPEDVDVFVATVAGIVDAQLSNDPGGNRWTRHLDRAITMVFEDSKKRKRRKQ